MEENKNDSELELDESEEGTEEVPAEQEGNDDPYADLSHEEAIKRLRKAEKAIMKSKQAPRVETKPTEPSAQSTSTQLPTPSGVTREEALLYSRGYSLEEVEKARVFAQAEGEKNLLLAVELDTFKAWRETTLKKAEEEKARLGASRGALKTKPKRDFKTPGLTDEEHRNLWRQRTGK